MYGSNSLPLLGNFAPIKSINRFDSHIEGYAKPHNKDEDFFLLSLSLLCSVAFEQCFGGIGYNPLAKLIEAQRSQDHSVHFPIVGMATEYSPVYVEPQDGLKEADKIAMLPGQPNAVNVNQYAGYVTVDPTAGRALFYYFVESQNSSDKPLVSWLNDGNSRTKIFV